MLEKAVGMARAQKLPEGHPDYMTLHSPSKYNSITMPCFYRLRQYLSKTILGKNPIPVLRGKMPVQGHKSGSGPPCLHQSGPQQRDELNGLVDSL